MVEPVTHKQMNDQFHIHSEAMKKFISQEFKNKEKLDSAHRENLDQRMSEGSKKMEDHHDTLYGNGGDGLVKLVDRLWQGRYWVSVLALAVVGKIIADIFMK
jgi:hypothetical protein